MSNQNFENNDMNGTGTVGGPSCHPATARVKWNKEVNKVLMEWFYKSKTFDEEEKPIKGYRKRKFRE